MDGNNALVIRKVDVDLIKMIRELSPENQALARGIVIGMAFQKKRAEPQAVSRMR